MDVFGSTLPNEVGLRLLLSPFGSNVVIRTACCSVGVVLPVYSTFKAIERKDQDDQQKWLIYWTAYGSFSIVEMFSDKLLSWFPMYYHLKFAFLVWLQLPSAEGASQLYKKHLRPFLLRHQARIDQLVGFTYHQTTLITIPKSPFTGPSLQLSRSLQKLAELTENDIPKIRVFSSYQAGFQFAKTLLIKIMSTVDLIFSNNQQGHNENEIPPSPISDTLSDHED